VDLSLTDAEERFAAEARAWFTDNTDTPPDTEDLAEAIAWGRAWQAKLAAAGWVGINWPVEYGGRGASPVEVALFNTEYARSGAAQLVNRVGINLAGPCWPTGLPTSACAGCRRSRRQTRSGASSSANREPVPT
jgi:alkylation response protein AidB-like acyl-CoA dehydrogenase